MQNRKTHIDNRPGMGPSHEGAPGADKPGVSRRRFIFSMLTAAGAIVFGTRLLADERFGNRASFLRPPGAVPEPSFLKQCIGCAKCMEACTNDCIVMLDAEAGMKRLNTPIIVPRTKGCTLCMACTQVCPTHALAKISPQGPFDRHTVTMGVAKLNKSVCFSYNGRTCGVCYQACPLQGKAMTIGLFEQPVVHQDACVGCGLCEQACLHLPQAIRVLDRERFA